MVEKSGNEYDTTMDLVGDREIVVSRTFRAPPRIVFEAWTKAEYVRRWWAPAKLGAEIVECTADVRVGGKWRYVLRNRGGDEVAFSGVYSEVTPHSRLAYSSIFEPFPDVPVAVTVTFEERDGHTRLVTREVYSTAESLQAALSTGMEKGMRETMHQLEELVSSMAG